MANWYAKDLRNNGGWKAKDLTTPNTTVLCKVLVGGAVKDVVGAYVLIGGAVKSISAIYTEVNGSVKALH